MFSFLPFDDVSKEKDILSSLAKYEFKFISKPSPQLFPILLNIMFPCIEVMALYSSKEESFSIFLKNIKLNKKNYPYAH